MTLTALDVSVSRVPTASVVFASLAIARIEQECRRSDTETGGLLIGRRVTFHDRPVLVVLEATGPGTTPDRQHITYAPDHQDLNRQLEDVRAHHVSLGVDYVGEWHKHPPSLSVPSDGDFLQAQAILESDDYNLPHSEVLIPIAVVDRAGRVGLRVFCARRGQRTWQEYELVQVADSDARALLETVPSPAPAAAAAPVAAYPVGSVEQHEPPAPAEPRIPAEDRPPMRGGRPPAESTERVDTRRAGAPRVPNKPVPAPTKPPARPEVAPARGPRLADVGGLWGAAAAAAGGALAGGAAAIGAAVGGVVGGVMSAAGEKAQEPVQHDGPGNVEAETNLLTPTAEASRVRWTPREYLNRIFELHQVIQHMSVTSRPNTDARIEQIYAAADWIRGEVRLLVDAQHEEGLRGGFPVWEQSLIDLFRELAELGALDTAEPAQRVERPLPAPPPPVTSSRSR